MCNYGDDTIIYVFDSKLESVINRLESETVIPSEWFQNNYMKRNVDK